MSVLFKPLLPQERGRDPIPWLGEITSHSPFSFFVKHFILVGANYSSF